MFNFFSIVLSCLSDYSFGMFNLTKGVIRQTDNTIEKRLNIPKE
jgi:hypothetical protein